MAKNRINSIFQRKLKFFIVLGPVLLAKEKKNKQTKNMQTWLIV